jgi:hypothetical protein
MRLSQSLLMQTALAFAFVLSFFPEVTAQTAVIPSRMTGPVDEESLVTLRGNTHPLARPEYDQGAARDSLPMERVLLVLQRSAEQETALRKLLDEQQNKSSPNYHQWLTPEQFGQQFGPADADIQAVRDWLASQGFQVSYVAAGRTVIEFSGTAGQVRQAFHTEMHKFVVDGEQHWANVSDPEIPVALTPVVAGIASLNNFPRKSRMPRPGTFSKSKATGVVRPLFTYTSNGGTYYAIGPTDFATIYNVLPLWNTCTGGTCIDGAGQTIAIVAQTNINLQDVADFRTMFNLQPVNNLPQIVLNGPDPGVIPPSVSGDEGESDLDVEWTGAVAKGATVDLVVSKTTATSAGIDLSALYIIDNNLAPVLSEGYGACEVSLGTGGNTFYNTLWEQGAAQGITIIVSAGDSGSAGCDNLYKETAAQYGLAVSGNASTPFDVAVGGTDFNDDNNWSTYWDTANSSTTRSSAISYIPEMTWNDSCANTGQLDDCASAGSDTSDAAAGAGGPSSCVTSTAVACTGGYAKPSWQSGPGVPKDNVRDIPDVSLFAGDSYNRSFYVICESDAVPAGDASCDANASLLYFEAVKGTSASAQAFAGIMALVNQMVKQKSGVEGQGNANYVLYPMAAQSGASCASNQAAVSNSSCIFYDIQTGNNSVACLAGSPNCSTAGTSGYGILVYPSGSSAPAWPTNAGYDLATGLGSVNAANLVNNWTSVSLSGFTIDAAPGSSLTQSVSAGEPATYTLSLSPVGGFDGTINLSCSGAPTGATCTPSPPSLSLSGSSAVTATVTITMAAQTMVSPRAPELRVPPSLRLRVGLPWLLAGLLALTMLRSLIAQRRRPVTLAFATTLLVVGVWVACGGGGGSGGSPPPAPDVSLSSSSLTFSSQGVGTTSAAQSVTLSNTGNAALNISSIAISGTNAGDFALTNTCGSGLAAGANHGISVTFTPAATGTRSASLAITDNASGSPQTVSLSGMGASASTPPGTYHLTVTASSNGVTHTVPLTLTVTAI